MEPEMGPTESNGPDGSNRPEESNGPTGGDAMERDQEMKDH